MTAACFVGAALVRARPIRPSRPWRSPLQARDLRDETPWAALPPSCLPCSLPSVPPCVTAHHAPSLPRPRNRLVASGGGGLTRPSFGGRSGNANSNAPERAQVQSDLASRRRNQAPSGDPFARDCLKGSAVRFLLAKRLALCVSQKTSHFP